MNDNSLLQQFLDLGLFEGQQLLVLDLEKCTRCDECVRACSDGHGGITRIVRDGPRFEHFLVALSCRSCHDPRCLEGCPVDAIHRDGFGLEIKIADHCIGCAVCATNCPFGSIHMVELEGGVEKELAPEKWRTFAKNYTVAGIDDATTVHRAKVRAVNCDLCSSLERETTDRSGKRSTTPRCVYACPHDAAHRMRGQEVLDCAQRHRTESSQAEERGNSSFGWLWTLLGVGAPLKKGD